MASGTVSSMPHEGGAHVGDGRRLGRAQLVDLEGLTSATASSQVDALGVGRYQALLFVAVGVSALAESVEMGSAAPMHSALTRAFGLTTQTRAALPAFTVAGSALGMLIAGPLCDRYGRKSALLWSNIGICASMMATAWLPPNAGEGFLLSLRFLAGVSGALGVPAGCVLAVEASPRLLRAKLMFGISFLSSFGYLVSAIGLRFFMPYLGEADEDAWRSFYIFVAIPSLVAVPLIVMLCESPCFLAVNGQTDECAKVLCHMARANGRHLLPSEIRLPLPPPPRRSIMDLGNKVWTVVAFNSLLVVLLSVVDGCRGYFIAGSSYVWKDFFSMAAGISDPSVSPALLNVLASLAPLVGLAIGERFVWLGVRRVTFVCCALAAGWVMALITPQVQSNWWLLVAIVMAVKLTYGPISTCVALMKTEAFPTEIRVSAFSLVSVLAKFASAVAPTAIEELKGIDASWTDKSLSDFVSSLCGAALLCGILALSVPGQSGDGAPLEDYVDAPPTKDKKAAWRVPLGEAESNLTSIAKSAGKQSYGSFHDRADLPKSASCASMGSIWDIWEEDSEDSDETGKKKAFKGDASAQSSFVDSPRLKDDAHAQGRRSRQVSFKDDATNENLLLGSEKLHGSLP